ncbi:MAG TPA: hypothetical protein VMU61_17075 [Candidatus Aquilonibacter sp.]|nr:hypothetical protein [Candidatus Aquilonibacter sp.]
MSISEPLFTYDSEGRVLCPLCQKPVHLETCKIDEHGRAVHEECYVRLLQQNQYQPGK